MSTYDNASLILIPSGVKDGKVYSAKPTNGDGDFTFTRASEATRLVDGVVTKVRTNSLLQSNDFSDASWVKNQVTLTSNDIANPLDGAITGSKVTPNTSTSGHFISQSITGGLQTASVYAKEGEYATLILFYTVHDGRATFNLSNGTITETSGSVGATIASVGNGWYRCSLYTTLTTHSQIRFYIINGTTWADASVAGDGTSGLYVFGSQLEQGLVSTPYIATTTVAVSEGPVANMPRLNSVAGGCRSLKLEPQRTNLFPYSEYFNTDWSIYRGTITDNATASPVGVVNASKFEEDSATGQHFIRKTVSMTSGNDYTGSVFAKASEKTSVTLGSSNTGQWAVGATFNLSTGAVTSGTGSVESFANGWYRCSVTASCTVTASLGLEITTTSGAGSSGDGLYLYGAQLEEGSYATSYIPNYGTAAGVTRVADACSKTGISSLIGQTEGTLFVEASALEDGADSRITLSDGSIGSRLSIEWDAVDGTIKGFLGTNGNTTATGYDHTNTNKIAVTFNASEFKMFINGTLVGTDTSPGTITAGERINFSNYNGASVFLGDTNQVLIFKTKLTDAEAITLTTL